MNKNIGDIAPIKCSVQGCRRTILAIAFLICCFVAHGASIEWGMFTVTDWDLWAAGRWSVDGVASIMFQSDGSVVETSYGSPGMSGGAYWVYASYGDALATLADYQQKPLALDSTFTGDAIVAGDNINSHRDDNGFLYLSVIVRSGGTPPYFWGWALLQGQTVVESALSDMPLVVGTGQVIPEPSAALLLLVGGALLVLRRRRDVRFDQCEPRL